MSVKGSWSRVKNIKQYHDNHNNIDWNNSYIYCNYCGGRIPKQTVIDKPNLFIFHKDNSIEHKNCNFN